LLGGKRKPGSNNKRVLFVTPILVPQGLKMGRGGVLEKKPSVDLAQNKAFEMSDRGGGKNHPPEVGSRAGKR